VQGAALAGCKALPSLAADEAEELFVTTAMRYLLGLSRVAMS
jgi:hypothetical protein